MNIVLANGLLLNAQPSGVQSYTENLFCAMNFLLNDSVKINLLLSKGYSGKLQNSKCAVNPILLNFDTTNRLKRILFEQVLLARYLKRKNFDLYHSTSYILPCFLSGPSVLTIHDLIALDYPKFCQQESILYFNLFLPLSIRKATKIIAVSNKVKNDILKRFDISPDRVSVIYHGISEQFKKVQSLNILNEIIKKYKLPQQFILFVGNIEPKKNLKRIIEAFNQLKRYSEIKHKLVVVGQKGWKYTSVFEIIAKLDIKNEVLFTGYVPEEDLPGIYSLADVFVFPSLYEGFGIPPLEAMACETPVLVSNQGALPETTGGNCLQVNPYEINNIAKGMYTLLTDENLRKGEIGKCKKWASQFTWDKAASKTLALYEKTIFNIDDTFSN